METRSRKRKHREEHGEEHREEWKRREAEIPEHIPTRFSEDITITNDKEKLESFETSLVKGPKTKHIEPKEPKEKMRRKFVRK